MAGGGEGGVMVGGGGFMAGGGGGGFMAEGPLFVYCQVGLIVLYEIKPLVTKLSTSSYALR